MKYNPMILSLVVCVFNSGSAIAANKVVFLETMAATAVKPWTGTGCNNAWTVST